MDAAPALANIDEAGKRRRVAIGLVLADGAVVAAIALVLLGVDRWWRATLFVPFFIGVLCLLQARAHCWVFIAPRGLREVGGQHAPIGDATVTALLTAISRKIWLRTTLWAALFTAIALAIPW